MSGILDTLPRLVTARPVLTIAALLVITVGLAWGATLRLPPTEGADTAFLPADHPIVLAQAEIDELFADTGDVRVASLVFRGDPLSPGGLAQISGLLDAIASDPAVSGALAPTDAIISPTQVFAAVLRTQDFGSVPQAQIDALLQAPELQPALSVLTGIDVDGGPVAVAHVRLTDTGDERVDAAEWRIDELADASSGPARASSISPAVLEDEYKRATEEGMQQLAGIALLLVAALLLLFTRSIADVLLTLAGLTISILWVVGAEGWLGPDGLGLIGPPSSLTSIVPIIMISLTVDYAIQTISHYREQRLEGENVQTAIRQGVRNVSVPLTLAAVTTIVSLLANRFSPIGVLGDFGVVAGLGVGLSLIVMLTLIPAGRILIDRRRERRGTLKPPRPISTALPGVPKAAESLGSWVTRRPMPYIVGVLLATAALGYAATGLAFEFSIRDVLPRGGGIVADLDTLDAAVGGSSELGSILIEAEATEIRTLLNLDDLAAAFADESRRPDAAAGPISGSYEQSLLDWTQDSGEPGDKYDADLAALFSAASVGVQLDPATMQQIIDRLLELEPDLSHFLANDPNGVDTILLQVPLFTDSPARSGAVQEQVEALWQGDDSKVTATSSAIDAIAVTDQITEGQTGAISTTVAVALGVLSIFFWITVRQPALGIVAVGPIVLVLICVLGTMALLGIPYSLITSIITALSIGIGVDYTIHIIHRYREEFTRLRNPEAAAVRTLATTGSALLGSALTTAVGFGVLIASPIKASADFGLTATITIVYSLVVSVLMVLPAMVIWGAYQNMRIRASLARFWEELDDTIEAVHRRHEQGESS